MKVKNMTSNKGNAVPNQFFLYDDDGNVYFQSYKSIVAKMSHDGQVTLDENYWNYSATTGKYRNQFLAEGIADTRKKIKSGEYILADLNN